MPGFITGTVYRIQTLSKGNRECRERGGESEATTHQSRIEQDAVVRLIAMKEVSIFEVLIRNLGRFAAGSGVVALLVWLTWIMLDVQHMQSGFTLPQSSY